MKWSEVDFNFDMMGIANMAFALHPDAIEMLRSRSGQGLEIRVLQCAPANPGLPSLVGQRDAQHLNTVRNEIEAAAEAWKRIVDLPDLDLSITVRRAMSSLPLASALLTDRAVVATPYLHTRPTAQSPTLYAVAEERQSAVQTESAEALPAALSRLQDTTGELSRQQGFEIARVYVVAVRELRQLLWENGAARRHF